MGCSCHSTIIRSRLFQTQCADAHQGYTSRTQSQGSSSSSSSPSSSPSSSSPSLPPFLSLPLPLAPHPPLPLPLPPPLPLSLPPPLPPSPPPSLPPSLSPPSLALFFVGRKCGRRVLALTLSPPFFSLVECPSPFLLETSDKCS